MSDFNTMGRGARRLRRMASLSGLVVAAGLGANPAAAIQTDFGVDYRATTFYVDSNAFDNDTAGFVDSDQGFAQYLRVEADFKHEETGVQVITRVELSGDRWTGDERQYSPTAQRAFNTTNTGDTVRLDLGFVQIPIGKTLIRVGRQEANFNNCFLVCDDRRDRIFAARGIGPVNAFVLYDRRQDNASFANIDNGDQFLGGFVTPLGKSGWNLGALYLYYNDNYDGQLSDYAFLPGSPVQQSTDAPGGVTAGAPYVLDGGQAVSAYMTGALGAVDIEFGTNIFYEGDVDNDTTPGREDFLNDVGWAEYLRIGTEFDRYALRAQYIGTQDGGYLSTGFDTYTSTINSNPESTANPTSVYSVGRAFGVKNFNQNFFVANGTVDLTDKLALGASVGALNISIPDSAGGQSDTSMVYDAELSYQYNSVFRTWFTAGWVESNDAIFPQGNSLIGSISGTNLDDNHVFATSLNIGVEF
ncbi:hypothetical protein [Salinisphaera japonica]|uniref:Alginate export domain-containing protein n=1 Tax=Salinisphaera japonica YTM-1 TaxID=1209778 RepID=A0A423Q0C1_9GAMM|nr:hypothetical protein [Salinisphaera japonica]ROO31440.1 hypothetical protein SAJA_02905 [Salinisphaera japonica YTM-1]